VYGVENRTTVPIEVTFSVAKSQNIAFNTTVPTIKKVIQPNRFETLIHVRRNKLTEPLHFDYDLKYKVLNTQ
jgi:hypothetical protein